MSLACYSELGGIGSSVSPRVAVIRARRCRYIVERRWQQDFPSIFRLSRYRSAGKSRRKSVTIFRLWVELWTSWGGNPRSVARGRRRSMFFVRDEAISIATATGRGTRLGLRSDRERVFRRQGARLEAWGGFYGRIVRGRPCTNVCVRADAIFIAGFDDKARRSGQISGLERDQT